MVLTFERCAAYVADQDGDSTAVGWAESYTSAAGARQAALSECGSRGGSGSVVRVWGCNGSVVEDGLGLDRAARRQVQEGLQAAGFDAGGADGIFGPRTRSAIAKMKDGRTHLAHKAEHGVGLETGAILSVMVQDASEGDSATLPETLTMVAEQVEAVQPAGAEVEEVVADKGYHSDATLVALDEIGVRSYVSEPERGRRCWQDKKTGETPVGKRAAQKALVRQANWGIEDDVTGARAGKRISGLGGHPKPAISN